MRLGGGIDQAVDFRQRAAGLGAALLGDVLRGQQQGIADFALAAGGVGAGLLPFLAQRGGHLGQRAAPGVQALRSRGQLALQGEGGLGRVGGGVDQAVDFRQRAAGLGLRLSEMLRGQGQRVADFALAVGGVGASLLPFLAQRGGHLGQRAAPGVQALAVARGQFVLQREGGLGASAAASTS